jgi:peptide/nickel transport system ATP-binding protein
VLADLQRELGIALLLITHDLGVVARIANRVAVMYAGDIVETASAATLFADPRHPYTRGLLASIPVPGRTAPGSRLGAIPGVVPSLFGEVRGCAFRNRCAYALPACAEIAPWQAQGAHGWRCIYDELPARAA